MRDPLFRAWVDASKHGIYGNHGRCSKTPILPRTCAHCALGRIGCAQAHNHHKLGEADLAASPRAPRKETTVPEERDNDSRRTIAPD